MRPFFYISLTCLVSTSFALPVAETRSIELESRGIGSLNGPISWLCNLPILSKVCTKVGKIVAPNPGSTVVVVLPVGPVIGSLTSNARRFSLPYAQPPVGNLRFADPVAIPSWTAPKNATTLPQPCPQQDDPTSVSFQEDCLYMNVYTPASATGSSKLPVMVWVHGGSNLVGSAEASGLDGSALANAQSIVVVVLQYRLGIFGFFSGPSGINGNQGVKDIVMALKFVQTNIRSLGGDPTKVTLAGQSSGASLVSTLLSTPSADTLFLRAILQSTPLNYGDLAPAAASGVGTVFTTALNCATTTCLRSASVQDILNAQDVAYVTAPAQVVGVSPSMPLRPVVDGTLVKGNFLSLANGASGGVTAKRSVIFSTVTFEAAPAINLIATEVMGAPGPLPLSDFELIINTLITPPSHAQAIISTYTPGTGTYAVNDALELSSTDQVFRCPTQQVAVNATVHGQVSSVYLVQVDVGSAYPDNVNDAYCNGKTCHEDDIYETFDNTPNPTAVQSTVQAEHVARWGSFVKTGNPNAAGYIQWSPVSSATSLNMLYMAATGSTIQQTQRPANCGPNGFWGNIVPFDVQTFGP